MRRPRNSGTGEDNMETFTISAQAPHPLAGTRRQAIVGVVASGNLEILLERIGGPRKISPWPCPANISLHLVNVRLRSSAPCLHSKATLRNRIRISGEQRKTHCLPIHVQEFDPCLSTRSGTRIQAAARPRDRSTPSMKYSPLPAWRCWRFSMCSSCILAP